MKKIIAIISVACLILLFPCKAAAQVTARIIEQELTPSVIDIESDREYASVSYSIEVKGAKGHTIRVEIPWKNIYDKPVYFNIDEKEIALSNDSYTIEADSDTIVGWCGSYHDSFWLKPGLQKINGTIRLYDETLGKYIALKGAKKHSFTFTSYKKPQGVELTEAYLEHNKYIDGKKVMYVNYSVEMNWFKGKDIRCEVSLHRANGTPIYCYDGKADKNTSTMTPNYTFCVYSDRWVWFSYSSMKVPNGKTNCYALIRFYDVKTGKLLAKSNKLEFYLTR